MKHRKFARLPIAIAALVATAATANPSQACGGLFCSQSSPVNQAAERIVFAQQGDTTTAIIEIQYEGPSESFSWVLPVPGTPEVALSSTQALDQLQMQTNPIYQLNTTFEPCEDDGLFNFASGDDAESSATSFEHDVTVINSGNVGPYDYELLRVDQNRDDAAGLVLQWLDANGYDVTSLGEELLADYLSQGLNLLAFRLNKNAPSGSIRPIRITYEGSQPMIPIRPTAVAANPDMGIMVWILGKHRAIPHNYLSLELNEMLIDWFNPSGTYDAVVTRAADDAGGQGFVTEMSDSTKRLSRIVYFEDGQAEQVRAALQGAQTYRDTWLPMREWDGFDDVISRTVPVPAGTSPQDVIDCLDCVLDMLPAVNRGELEATLPPAANFTIEERSCEELDLTPGDECTAVMGSDGRPLWDPERFIEELETLVLAPMRDTQALLDEHDTFTRLYTTMSADEMTMDPVFDFNPDLDTVTNVHTRTRNVGCNDNWEVFFAEGRVSNDSFSWPVGIDTMPANRRVLQHGISGDAMVLEDNREEIRTEASRLKQFAVTDDGCGCRVVGSSQPSRWSLIPLVVASLLLRRRRANS